VVIETDRLCLRRVTVDDIEELVEIHADPAIMRFMGAWDRARALEWLARVDRNWQKRGYGRFVITDRGSGRLLGRTGLMFLPEFSETELGWTLRREAWGHGYATEAAGACANWAFGELEIPYLTSLIEPGNERSIRVASRLGMAPVRNDVFQDRPMIVHAVTRDSWLAPQSTKRCPEARLADPLSPSSQPKELASNSPAINQAAAPTTAARAACPDPDAKNHQS
jgi:RimJ/RimL family protein N-acetyltransferase